MKFRELTGKSPPQRESFFLQGLYQPFNIGVPPQKPASGRGELALHPGGRFRFKSAFLSQNAGQAHKDLSLKRT